MKTLLPASLALLLTASLLSASPDIRRVNGVAVDIACVDDWYRTNNSFHQDATLRPMQHWKKVQIVDVLDNTAGYYRAQIKFEDKQEASVYMSHMSPQILQVFQERITLSTGIANETSYIATEQNNVDQMKPPTSPFPDDMFLKEKQQNFQRTVNRMRADISAHQARLADMQQRLGTLESKHSAVYDLAMYSGKKYGGLDIWDCGH